MTTYTIRKTDINEPTITVPQETVIRGVVDLPIIGQFKTDYGTEVNQSLLNLLENFACPEAPGATNDDDAVPDLSKTSDDQLGNPTAGQLWYNSTREKIYYWDGTTWAAAPIRNQYAANWGRALHGQYLPKPVARDGRVFEYSECIWSVSPAVFSAAIDTFNCNTDQNAKVTVQQRYAGREGLVNSVANYLIIGIDNNVNNGRWDIVTPIQVSPTPSPTASVTPTVTATVTPSVTTSVTPSISPTQTPTQTPSRTPAVTPSNTPPVTPPATPTPTPSNTVVTYCWTSGQLCLGFLGDNNGTPDFRRFWKDNTSGQPTPDSCAYNTTYHSAFGLIYYSYPVRFLTLAASVPITITASNGAQNSQNIIFNTTKSPSENYFQETVTRTLNVGGVDVPIQALMTWNKRAGNNNAADGTLTVQLSFPNGGRC